MSYGIGGFSNNKGLIDYATVTDITSDGVVICLSSEKKGIIPLEHLELHNTDVHAFRVGEHFGVFPLVRKHKGGRKTETLNSLPCFCLRYKSINGKVYVSSKLDRIQSGINVAFEQFDDDEKREYLFDLLDNILWDDTVALFQLYDFCFDGTHKMDERVKRMLIARYVLDEDGSLPAITNEVVFESRTGCKPFWLEDEDDDKIIDITKYQKKIE